MSLAVHTHGIVMEAVMVLTCSALMMVGKAETAYPLTALDNTATAGQLLSRNCWKNIPEIKNFRIRSSDNFFTTGNYAAFAAYQDHCLWIRIECDRGDDFYFAMQKRYHRWMLDNGAEIFLKEKDRIHKIVLNAREAICYSVNGEVQTLPKGTQLKGKLEPGCWTLVLGLPCQLTDMASMGLNIHLNQPYSFTVFGAMTNDTGPEETRLDPVGKVVKTSKRSMKFVPFKLVEKLDEQNVKEIERQFNGDFYRMLESFDDCDEIEELKRFEEPCHWDLSGLKKKLSQLKNCEGGLKERERLYRELRTEYARFQCHIYPVAKDSFVTETPGPLTVDFSRSIGRIRHVNGTNLGPRIYGGEYLRTNEPFKNMNFSYVRTHDAPLDNPGVRLVDTSLIFANFHDDPRDPRNYFFKPTDDYLRNIVSLGCGVVYRLGVSIEHSVNKYAAHAPEDYEKYAEICAGIVRHYNAGWANGYHLGIRYWEIWNEPNIGPKMWDRGMDEFYKFYVIVAKRLKQEFPDIKVGGYGAATFNQDHLIALMKQCLKAGAPLDFYSWHLYNDWVQVMVTDPHYVRALLDAFGFKKTETHFNEWHYFANSWGDFSAPDGMESVLNNNMGIDSGVFTAQVLSRWQDAPLDVSNYYATFLNSWAVRNYLGKYNKNYYALVAYGAMVRHQHRVAATSNSQDCFVLAGHDGKGHGAALVTAFQVLDRVLELDVRGVPELRQVTVRVVDGEHDLKKQTVPVVNRRIRLEKTSKSALFLIEFDLTKKL